MAKILIVEDQMLIALDLERLIAGMDYQVCGIARTRTEALRLAEEHLPDLVVMDVRLADGSDGIAAARELRQRFGIAALLISGQIDAAQAEQAEASSFLRKPFEARQLRRAIADALRESPRRVHDAVEESVGDHPGRVVAVAGAGRGRRTSPVRAPIRTPRPPHVPPRLTTAVRGSERDDEPAAKR